MSGFCSYLNCNYVIQLIDHEFCKVFRKKNSSNRMQGKERCRKLIPLLRTKLFTFFASSSSDHKIDCCCALAVVLAVFAVVLVMFLLLLVLLSLSSIQTACYASCVLMHTSIMLWTKRNCSYHGKTRSATSRPVEKETVKTTKSSYNENNQNILDVNWLYGRVYLNNNRRTE